MIFHQWANCDTSDNVDLSTCSDCSCVPGILHLILCIMASEALIQDWQSWNCIIREMDCHITTGVGCYNDKVHPRTMLITRITCAKCQDWALICKNLNSAKQTTIQTTYLILTPNSLFKAASIKMWCTTPVDTHPSVQHTAVAKWVYAVGGSPRMFLHHACELCVELK